jgi:predicted O-linked N-acetylglucosamine transferase (SPINDLY family)
MRMDTIEGAIELFRRGQVREAEAVCERRLALAPNDGDTLSLLAEILLAGGSNDRAAVVLTEIIALRPEDAAARRRLGATLLALGRAVEAADVLRASIRLEPASPRAHNNLGQALLQLERTPDAIASFEAALRLDPRYAIAHNNLGLAYTASGEPSLALDCLRRAIALDPSLVIAVMNMALVFDRCDQPVDALGAYERALAVAPHLVEAWMGRGVTLAKLDRWEPALESFARALELKPGDAVTMIHRAGVFLSTERAPESLAAADAALQVDDRSAQAHTVRAGALRRLGRRPEAVVALERALALDPRHVDAWANLGTILHEMGRVDEAITACRKVLELDPTGVRNRTRMLSRLIPPVPGSEQELTDARDAFNRQLAELQAWLAKRTLSQRDALTIAQQQFFYLTYQEQSNRPILQSYRSACAARLAGFGDLSAPPAGTAAERTRFRLGFVSAHVYDHSVFNAILRGWLQCLSPERFELSLFSVGTRGDGCTEAAAASVEHFDRGIRGIAEWAARIRDRELDAIVYPEVGMNETTLALASLRLAPRQFVAWGHPETSGLPSIDGYLSADLFEPPDAQDHYSESLVRLPNLGVHCLPYRCEATPVDLATFGIVGAGPVFVCPGVPFKYRPQDDWILADIARQLGCCTFVFFEHEIPELSRRLEARIAAAFANGGVDPKRHLRTIPRQPRAAFFGLLRQADVYLDTIGFSGFNTVMQAVECHLPCVTHEGRFLRGRLGSGILKRLAIPGLIAHDAREYINLALTLGGDAGYRAKVRTAIRSAEHRLYADLSAVDALSNRLLASREEAVLADDARSPQSGLNP